MGNEGFVRWRPVAIAVAFEGSLGLLACGLAWAFDRGALDRWHWEPSSVAYGTAAAVPLLAAFVLAVHFPVGPLRKIDEIVQSVLVPLFAPCTSADLALVALAAGLCEEMLFRGVLQVLCVDWFGLVAGLFVASALFGLAHLITLTYAVLAGLIGMYLGWLFVSTDNLLTAVVAHSVYDFGGLVYLVRRRGSRELGSLTELQSAGNRPA